MSAVSGDVYAGGGADPRGGAVGPAALVKRRVSALHATNNSFCVPFSDLLRLFETYKTLGDIVAANRYKRVKKQKILKTDREGSTECSIFFAAPVKTDFGATCNVYGTHLRAMKCNIYQNSNKYVIIIHCNV